MLLVDSREGGKDPTDGAKWLRPLQRLGLPAVHTRLESGDLAFEGKGDGEFLTIGVELKTLSDFIGSVRSGRLNGQIAEMAPTYDVRWLVVQGATRWDSSGALVRQVSRKWQDVKPVPGHMSVSEYHKRHLTHTHCAGMHVWPTVTQRDTLQFVHDLYRWWTDEAYEEHRSHLAPLLVPDSRLGIRRSYVEQAASLLPGIGAEKAKAVARHFKTAYYMVAADEREWMTIGGIGATIAKACVQILRHGEE